MTTTVERYDIGDNATRGAYNSKNQVAGGIKEDERAPRGKKGKSAKRGKATKSAQAQSNDNGAQGPPTLDELKNQGFTLLKWEGR